MTMSIVWLVALIIFVVAEAATVGLTSIWFALGSLAALIASAAGAPIIVQVVLFIGISILSLVLVRPLGQRYLNAKRVPTNADRILGAEAVVTEEIDNLKGQGHVSVAGVPWTARSEYNEIIPADTVVCVLRIEGVKVFVAVKEQ